jgi:REP element-mobilizing transposase RayT
MEERRRWHTRGYPPHFDGEVCQFITLRLADSLPQAVLNRLEEESKANKLEKFYDREKQIRIEEFLDKGAGECLLGVPVFAELVVEALFYFHGIRYLTYALVIMPNHVHWLMRPLEGWALSDIIKILKGSTAYLINKKLGRKGTVWKPDYFDRYIRDSEHFERAVRYIENNPVKAGLCLSPEDWPYSSANPELRKKLDQWP